MTTIVDREARSLIIDGRAVKASANTWLLCELLERRPGVTFSPDEITAALGLWHNKDPRAAASVVKRAREVVGYDTIRTHRGVGYYWVV